MNALLPPCKVEVSFFFKKKKSAWRDNLVRGKLSHPCGDMPIPWRGLLSSKESIPVVTRAKVSVGGTNACSPRLRDVLIPGESQRLWRSFAQQSAVGQCGTAIVACAAYAGERNSIYLYTCFNQKNKLVELDSSPTL